MDQILPQWAADLIRAYLTVLRKYAVFEGRARRREFWGFVLVNMVAGFLLYALGALTGLGFTLWTLYSIALIFPNLAVTARRLHDTERSGWWMLLSLLPVVGTLILVYFLVQDSTPGPNAYGPVPKH